MPIFGDGQIAGRIEVVAAAKDERALEAMARLNAMIDDVSPQITHIMAVGHLPVKLAEPGFQEEVPALAQEDPSSGEAFEAEVSVG